MATKDVWFFTKDVHWPKNRTSKDQLAWASFYYGRHWGQQTLLQHVGHQRNLAQKKFAELHLCQMDVHHILNILSCGLRSHGSTRFNLSQRPFQEWPSNKELQWRFLALSRGLGLPMPRPYRPPYLPGLTALIPHFEVGVGWDAAEVEMHLPKRGATEQLDSAVSQ